MKGAGASALFIYIDGASRGNPGEAGFGIHARTGTGVRGRFKLIWQTAVALLAAWYMQRHFEFVSINIPLAGEWVIGGVEAKGFAYALVLVGLERLLRDRWGWALLCFGAASSLHVIFALKASIRGSRAIASS